MFSPPCPSFSSGGLRLGRHDIPIVLDCAVALGRGEDRRVEARAACRDERSILAVEPLRWVLGMSPEWMVFEQVPAVLPLWEVMAGILRSRGLSVAVSVQRMEQFGVPQTRERAFLLARRDGKAEMPRPTHQRYEKGTPAEAALTLEGAVEPWVSMADTLGWDVAERVGFPRRNDLDDGAAYRERDTRPAGAPAFALTEKARSWRRWMPGEAITPQTGTPVSLDEAGRLQTFPAEYPWSGSRSSCFLQIGNAVPPVMAEALLAEASGRAAPGEVAA
jgi:DNA (cytosine-5)-methyltransferase 1